MLTNMQLQLYLNMFVPWMFLFCPGIATIADARVSPFVQYKKSNSTVKMFSFGPTIRTSTLVYCATHCAVYYSPCYSFTFNKTSRLCTPGSRIVPSTNPPVPFSGALYYIPGFLCDNSVINFTFISNGSVVSCFLVSDALVTYTVAHKTCQDIGAHLYTIKVPEKFYFLLSIADVINSTYWIGLNDFAEEGVYRWEDDNSVMDNITLSLYSSGEPNNFKGNEDCTYYSTENNMLNDIICTRKARTICEISQEYFLH